jgi:DNA-directed RNA polymerase subunit omega
MAEKRSETPEIVEENQEEQERPPVDSKYRLILIAAQRSKQLQRGAKPRVTMDANKHKATRIALEEVKHDKVDFKITEQL